MRWGMVPWTRVMLTMSFLALSVAFRMGHTEVPGKVLFCVPALLLAYDDHLTVPDDGQPGNHSGIIGVEPVAVKLCEP